MVLLADIIMPVSRLPTFTSLTRVEYHRIQCSRKNRNPRDTFELFIFNVFK